MQARLLPHAGELCRHLNVLRPSSCSTSSSAPVARAAGRRQHRQQAAALADAGAAPVPGKAGWTYKYKRFPCPSPCGKDDLCCQEVEALIQNVLSFPNMPSYIARVLPSLRADTRSMTALVEALAGHFGKELTLCYLRKQPKLLELSFATVLARCEAIKEVVGVRDSDIPQMLRKCPSLLLLEPGELRQRYENIPRMIQFTPLQVRTLVVKYPTVLTQSPGYVAGCVERLRQLCYTREEWARDFEGMSPGLLAYFLRDATDQLMRLEYLASTGERPEWMLREVMKPANRTFRSKLRNYRQWEMRVKQRRAQQKAAAAEAAAQAARSAEAAEAAAIKAAILNADSGSDEGAAPQLQRRRRGA